MKQILYLSFFAAVAISSCKKNDLNEDGIYKVKEADKALVKFIHSYTALTPSLATTPNGPTVDFYINNVKMNATAMSYLGLFPNVGGAYSEAPSGLVNIKAVLNRAVGVTGLSSDTIANGNFTLAPGATHSIILGDVLGTPLTPTLKVVNETINFPTYNTFRLRLLNLNVNSELLELYNATTGTVIIPSVPYNNFSYWVELPVVLVSNSYQIRIAGTANIIATAAAFTPANQRTYTFWARGNTAVTGRTRSLGFFTTY
jgi:hypothetical protein